MSYIVEIKRVDVRPIEPAEVRALIAEDPELELDVDEAAPAAPASFDVLAFSWRPSPSADPVPLVLNRDGVIRTIGGTPSNAILRKLGSIARALGARVVGEQGEDLTDAGEGPDVEPGALSGCLTCLGCSLVGLGPPIFLASWATRRWLCG